MEKITKIDYCPKMKQQKNTNFYYTRIKELDVLGRKIIN